MFGQARDTEATVEELVDDGWKAVEVEPAVVETHRNSNGHAANGVEPSVELVMGNGHHEEAAEGPAWPADRQQTLFSWAEFMAEEPVKPKGRGRKTQPATPSLFDWALDMEQEREAKTVSAGR